MLQHQKSIFQKMHTHTLLHIPNSFYPKHHMHINKPNLWPLRSLQWLLLWIESKCNYFNDSWKITLCSWHTSTHDHVNIQCIPLMSVKCIILTSLKYTKIKWIKLHIKIQWKMKIQMNLDWIIHHRRYHRKFSPLAIMKRQKILILKCYYTLIR